MLGVVDMFMELGRDPAFVGVCTAVGTFFTVINIILVSLFFYAENRKRFGVALAVRFSYRKRAGCEKFVDVVKITNLKESIVCMHKVYLGRLYNGRVLMCEIGSEYINLGPLEQVSIAPDPVSYCYIASVDKPVLIDFDEFFSYDSSFIRVDIGGKFCDITMYGNMCLVKKGKPVTYVYQKQLRSYEQIYGIEAVYAVLFACEEGRRGGIITSDRWFRTDSAWFVVGCPDVKNAKDVEDSVRAEFENYGWKFLQMTRVTCDGLSRSDIVKISDVFSSADDTSDILEIYKRFF